MVTAACLAWRLPVTTKASLRLIGSVVGLIVGIGLVASIANRIRFELGFGAASLSFVAALVAYAVAWMAMSMLLPRATTDPGALLPGAVLVGATLAGMQAVSQLYLPDKLGRASQAVRRDRHYHRHPRLVLFPRPRDDPGHVARRRHLRALRQHLAVRLLLPVVRVLPRKSQWIRGFFDIQE